MMVPTVSGPDNAPATPTHGGGRDEDAFASIFATLVGAAPPVPIGEIPTTVPGRSGQHRPAAIPEFAEAIPEAPDAAAGEPGTFMAEDVAGPLVTPPSQRHSSPVSPEVVAQPKIFGPILAGGSLEARVAPPIADSNPTSRSVASAAGDASHAMIGDGPLDESILVAPAVAEAATPTEMPFDTLGSVTPGTVRDDPEGPAVSPPLEAPVEDQSSVEVDGSIASDAVEDTGSGSPKPVVRLIEASPDLERPAGLAEGRETEIDAPTEVVSDSVTGTDTAARVASIREVVEWLEGRGLDSTPGEMRVEIPDGEGELIVRVTMVDGRVELDASGTDDSLPERWLDDLRRELDARGFDFAGSRQRRQEQTGQRGDTHVAVETNSLRRHGDSRPGVLL
ncbi:MAG: hypothetical protein WD990_08325 [Acidimicrobiia bacterium]